jgi:hypothetical protein
MPEMRVLDWILSDSDEGPSSGKEERASEGAANSRLRARVWQLRRGVEGAAKKV